MAYCLTINSKVCIQETNQWGFVGIPNPHYLYCTYGFILDYNSNKQLGDIMPAKIYKDKKKETMKYFDNWLSEFPVPKEQTRKGHNTTQ